MKTLTRNLFAATGLAVIAAFVGALSLPTGTAAFTLIGGSLGLTQRDFRVWNNYSDASANNNLVPHANFPGQTGAVMAIWKGEDEWASGPIAGNGLGDGIASNPVLGSGGANLDITFQGLAASSGGTNDNIHSELPGSDGGVLAFTETPINNGWRILYYSSWAWQDGPGSVGSGIDLQGVACHEIGHSLGLGHTSVGGATMFPSISGTGVAQRSIEADDIAGIQSIYGVKSATKPVITSLSGDKNIGANLVIHGTSFAATGGEVWFTKAVGDGVPQKVTGVSSTGGGTQITVTVPAGVMDGDVMVKTDGTGHSALSNAFPIDLGAPAGDPPIVVTVSPGSGPAGGFTPVQITGAGFTGTTSVQFGGINALSFTVDSNTQITAVSPPGTLFAIVDVTVNDVEGSSTLPGAYFYTFDPAPSITSVVPNTGSASGGTTVTITGPSVIGVSSVTFDGVPGTGLVINNPTTLTVTTPAGSSGPADVTANGGGSSTIIGGFSYVNFGSFTNIGPGVGGILGVPSLTGTGDLTPGSGTGFTITTSNGFPLSAATMFVGLFQSALPFKGGTFYTAPILLSISIGTDIFGGINLPGVIPAGVPSGTNVFVQTWVQDMFAPFGASGTNGLKLTTP